MNFLQKHIKQSVLAVSLIAAAAIYALIGIADPPSSTTITNEAISSFLFKTGQRIMLRSNMTETTVQNGSAAAVLDLTLSAGALIGNGVDSCLVRAMVYDASGGPVPDGQPVAFTTTRGAFSNGSDTTYTVTVRGQAVAWLRSEVVARQTVFAQVGATTLGASGQSIIQQYPLVFYAGGLEGKIVSADGRPVRSIFVEAYDNNSQEVGRDTTNAAGSFFIPIDRSGAYSLSIRYTNSFGDPILLSASASVIVPPVGGNQAVAPLNTVSGGLVDANTGLPVRTMGIGVILYRTSYTNQQSGRQTPALLSTDERGLFVFDSLAPGVAELRVSDYRFSGSLSVVHSERGTFVVDAKIGVVDASSFEVAKTANKRIVELGDVVSYEVEIRNTSTNMTLSNVRLFDDLPVSFVYAKGSAYRNGVPFIDPLNFRALQWRVADSLMPGERVKVSYSVHVGSSALEGNGINRAYAVATRSSGDTLRTAVSSVHVLVRPGIFTDRGIIIGKVFYDENEDGQQNGDERGIAGVELFMEDGTRVITGDDGKYSLPDVRPGQHVLRVNQLTLPRGATLLSPKSEFAQDGLTRFIRLTEGGIARSDFHVKPPQQAALFMAVSDVYARAAGESLPLVYMIRLHDIGTPTKVLLVDTLMPGFSFDLRSITWKSTKLFPQGKNSRTLQIDFPNWPSHSGDTVEVAVVADSSGIGMRPSSNAKLILSYARGEDAVFKATQLALDYRPPKPSEIPVSETKPVERTEVVPPIQVVEQPVQETTVKETSPKPRKVKQARRRAKRAIQTPVAVDTQSTKPVEIVQEPSIQDVPVPEAVKPLPDLPAETPEDSSAVIASVSYAIGAILWVLLIYLLRRRKRGGF